MSFGEANGLMGAYIMARDVWTHPKALSTYRVGNWMWPGHRVKLLRLEQPTVMDS